MAAWQKHIIGFVLPLCVGAIVFFLTPVQDPPDWMINVSALSLIIALFYAWFAFDRWMRRRSAHTRIAIIALAVGSIAAVWGITTRNEMIAVFGGLANVGVGIFLTGLFDRWAERLRKPSD